MKKLFIIFISLLVLLSPSLAQAANIPDNSNLLTWDWNYQRTASSISSSPGDPWTNPNFLSYVGLDYIYDFEIPTGQMAMVDPVYDKANNTVYQVTYDLNGNANIWAYTLQPGLIKPGGGPVKLTAGTNCVLNLDPTEYGSGSNIQAPEGLSISPDGKWMALGLGNYLFWWPLNGMAQVPKSSLQRAKITTVPSAVTASPLFTPDSKYVMIGDYEGGFVCANVNTDIALAFNMRQSDQAHGGPNALGACPYSGNACSGDAITSTPSWDPGTPSGSDADAWFGVADINGTGNNRLIMFNPYANGGYGQIDNDNIGLGVINGPVWSPVAVDPTTGDVFNTDYTGALYWWNAAGIKRNIWPPDWPAGIVGGTVESNIAILPMNGKNVDGDPDEDLVSWAGNSGRPHNAFAHVNGSTGVMQDAAAKLGATFPGASGTYKTLDPRLIAGDPTRYVGQCFEDNSTGVIYYSATPLDLSGNQGSKLQPTFYHLDQQSVSGYTSADADVAISGTAADPTYMSQMPDPSQLQVISTWTNRDVNGYPAIVWYLPTQRSLTLAAKDSNGDTAVSTSSSQNTLTTAAGGQVTFTAKYFGAMMSSDSSNTSVKVTLTSPVPLNPNPINLPYSFQNDPSEVDATYSILYGDSGTVSIQRLPSPPAGQSSYTIQATAQLCVGGQPVSGVQSGPINITVNATDTNVGEIPGLTLSSYHDNNLNNSGLDKAGFPNVETGDPLHIYYGDTMLADLVIKVPPLPGSDWRYDSATLRGSITYPDCKPVKWATGGPGNQTNCTTKTASFSVNTRSGSQENGTSVNDSITTFRVEWPTWRPPVGIIHHNWEGHLTATWTQTYTLQQHVLEGGKHPHWVWVTHGPYYQNGTSQSQDVKVTKTDIYYIMPGSSWEPYMRK
ncbi:hypothetical protein CEB3_c19580 [Peptococcaceae bacterium CEB3]|nr:hypothetical protein CEB3_c19580 [Peptococcaceae bacterium CEB3]